MFVARAHLLIVMLPRIRPNSVLAVRYGLLAKWFRVRVRVRVRVKVRAWARECNRCAFFFPLVL